MGRVSILRFRVDVVESFGVVRDKNGTKAQARGVANTNTSNKERVFNFVIMVLSLERSIEKQKKEGVTDIPMIVSQIWRVTVVTER